MISCEGISELYDESYGNGEKRMGEFCVEVADAIREHLFNGGAELYLYFMENGEKVAICRWDEDPTKEGWQLVWPQDLRKACGMMERHHTVRWVGDLIGKLPILTG